MQASELKEWLKEDVSRIEKVLESLGCHGMWNASSEEIRCAQEGFYNTTAISINTKTLYCRHYSAGETFRGDILGLVQHLKNEDSFSRAFNFVLSLFGLSRHYKQVSKIDPLAMFKKIRKKTHVAENLSEIDEPEFGREALEEFDKVTHINLFYEGIMPQISEQFEVCYDPINDRIVFPHFSYKNRDAIVGITGRTNRSQEEIEKFRVPKYFNYIKGYMKMHNLYGFSHALPFLEKSNKLIIFEAEKSTLKQFTQEKGEGFACSVGGHEISPIQLQIILKHTPPDTEIIIAFDKDIMNMKHEKTGEPIGEEFLIKTCNRFSNYRKTSYIWDSYNIIGEKDAPIDKGYKVWQHLLKYRKEV